MKPLKTILYILFSTCIAFTFYSCATLFSGTKQKVYLNSNPEGARIYVNGQDMGVNTPATVKISRRVQPSQYNSRNEYCFTLKKEGFDDYSIKYKRSLNSTILLNFISVVSAPVGFGIDFVSGAWMEYPEDVFGSLNPNGTFVQKSDPVKQTVSLPETTPPNSDVDINIPQNTDYNPYRFALIIGNEDYSSFQTGLSSEVNVAYAANDAYAFNEYATKTLGIPKENVIFLVNAKTVEMNRAINKLCLLSKSCNGKAELIVYYAGHGLPDEVSKEAYIMPVDVSGSDLQFAVKLKDLYEKLAEFPTKRITVFMDACFSGGARNQGLIAARGVKVRAKDAELKGNIVVFAASSGEQSSLPLKTKNHGIFTYYLLKKIQETEGNINYSDLSKYLSEQVNLNSIRFNDKEQNPQTIISPSLLNNWENWTLK